jgi:hypothetical protein
MAGRLNLPNDILPPPKDPVPEKPKPKNGDHLGQSPNAIPPHPTTIPIRTSILPGATVILPGIKPTPAAVGIIQVRVQENLITLTIPIPDTGVDLQINPIRINPEKNITPLLPHPEIEVTAVPNALPPIQDTTDPIPVPGIILIPGTGADPITKSTHPQHHIGKEDIPRPGTMTPHGINPIPTDLPINQTTHLPGVLIETVHHTIDLLPDLPIRGQTLHIHDPGPDPPILVQDQGLHTNVHLLPDPLPHDPHHQGHPDQVQAEENVNQPLFT